MAASTEAPALPSQSTRRPIWLAALAVFSLLLGLITTISQFYYVLFALGLVTIGPHSNFLGYIWYSYVLNGQQGGYLPGADSGIFASALEDAFMLGPLYITTSVGLWLRRSWVIPVGLMTGATIFYADLFFFLSSVLGSPPTLTGLITDVASALPYMAYPLWLIPTLLLRRSLFAQGSRR
jgi:hypothetical protein